MKLDKGDFFELLAARARVQIAELSLGEQQRRYRAVAERVGLKPDVGYHYDEDTFEVTEHGE